MIVCVCNNISDKEIQQWRGVGGDSLSDLKRDLGVATCCGCCEQHAAELLAQSEPIAAVSIRREAISLSLIHI